MTFFLVGGLATARAEVPRFFIEGIDVEGVSRVSPEIVLAQSRLVGGRRYSEHDLDEAVRRLERLPFLLDARFSLRRGAERGRFRLLISVEETRSIFAGVDLEAYRFDRSLALGEESSDNDNLSQRGLVGTRRFIGPYGVLHAAASSDAQLEVGYSHYNLFDRRVFLSLDYRRSTACCQTSIPALGLDPTFSNWLEDAGAEGASLTLGVPLSMDQSMRLDLSIRHSDRGRRRGILTADRFEPFRDITRRDVNLAWLYDTTDHVVFPTRGLDLSAGIHLESLQATPAEATASTGNTSHLTSRQVRLSVAARRHWPLARRHTVTAGGHIAIGRARLENHAVVADRAELELWEASVELRHTLRLLTAQSRRYGDLRWESRVDYSWEHVESELRLPHDSLSQWRMSTGLTLYNSWGLFRFALVWLDVGSHS